MSNVYVYESDDGFDIFLASKELTDEERYCSHCNEYAKLLKVITDINELIPLFDDYGYTKNTAKYHELISEFNDIVGGINDRSNSKEIDRDASI